MTESTISWLSHRNKTIDCYMKTYLFIIYILPVYSSKETVPHNFFCIIWAPTKTEKRKKLHITQIFLKLDTIIIGSRLTVWSLMFWYNSYLFWHEILDLGDIDSGGDNKGKWDNATRQISYLVIPTPLVITVYAKLHSQITHFKM